MNKPNKISNGMKLDGKQLAQDILYELKSQVETLKKNGPAPTLAVILIGDSKSSESYVRQKEKKAEEIGAQVKTFYFNENATNLEIEKLLEQLILNPQIHAVIIQRPAPPNIDVDRLTKLIPAEKEVDGFGTKSIYPVPVAKAVWLLIEKAWESERTNQDFLDWLKSKKITILGKGETAGRPIINYFQKKEVNLVVVDSKTVKRQEIIKNADIVISSVGKKILNPSDIKKGAILIGVGLHTDKEGKLKGDYDDWEMEEVASFYSPTPGGVGPVNVACLMKNLVDAAKNYL